MSTTVNSTLPKEWSATTTYYEGDTVVYFNIIYRCLQTSLNQRPAFSEDYWKPIDIYIKDMSVMETGYSGDANFWERDEIYIDGAGWVYVNNENTGINVRGPEGHVTVDLASLTPEQLAQIKGPQGDVGPQGPQGIQGPAGPAGEVVLTPEQIAILTGPDGKSAYQSWLDQGYTGTESDFVAWLRSGAITLDTDLDPNSTNGVENRAIANAFQTYRNNLTTLVAQLAARVTELENRLKYNVNNQDYYFKFGVTTEGKYGYCLTGTDTVIPFDTASHDILSSSGAEVGVRPFASEIGQYGAQPYQLTGYVEDANTITGTDFVSLSFQDAFGLYIYLYKDGKFYNEDYDMKLNGMTFNYISPSTQTDLYSNGEAIGEGILFSPSGISYDATKIYFVVEPLHAGDTINYQIGKFTNTAASLPTLITTGAYRTGYTGGSFTERTTIEYQYQVGDGVYFGSSSTCEYKIIAIYLE